MGLHTILKKMKEKEKELRLLMLGLDNAGKTTVVKKFNGEVIDLISPTLGFNIKTLEYRGFKLNVWDVGGQTSLRSYWRNYFEQTDGLIWVVDSADRARLRDCKAELQTLLQQEVRAAPHHAATRAPLRSPRPPAHQSPNAQRLAGASLLVFANKQDIEGALTSDEIREVRNEICDPRCAAGARGALSARLRAARRSSNSIRSPRATGALAAAARSPAPASRAASTGSSKTSPRASSCTIEPRVCRRRSPVF